MESWAKAFPGIDVSREIAKAYTWIQSNPLKAPKNDYARFLNAWLGRARPNHPVVNGKPDCDPTDPYRDCTPEQIAAINAFGERMMREEAERGNNATE